MKHLLLVLMALFAFTRVYSQGKEAIRDDADTMRKYIPENKLAELVTVRNIVIEGNKVTRRSVILREMSVHEGDNVYVDSMPQLLNQNKLRLVNLTLFNDVDLNVVRVNKNEVDWHLRVTERWYILPSVTLQLADMNFNSWWVEENHDLHRADVGLTIADKNFLGNLETLAATVQVGYTQKVAVNYIIPYIDKKQKSGLGFLLSAAKSQQTYYNTDSNKLLYTGDYSGPTIWQQVQAAVSYIYRPAYATRHTFQLTYEDDKVSDTVLKLNPDYYANGSTSAKFLQFLYRFELNEVDNWNYPVLGFKMVDYFIAREGFEGIKSQSYIHVEAGVFKNPFPKWFVSAIFRGRLMYPQNQPYAFEGGLGTQTDYVRGYEYYVINGSDYGVLRLDLKREIFNKTYTGIPLEYLTSVPLRVFPKIFADAGYIDSPEPGNSFLSNKLLYSVGVGLDVVTLYDLKIRLEFAYNHLGRNGLYLHLNSE
jgi:outer membrane protein assembly factor BamA